MSGRVALALKFALCVVIFGAFLLAMDFWRQRHEGKGRSVECQANGGRIVPAGEGFACLYEFRPD